MTSRTRKLAVIAAVVVVAIATIAFWPRPRGYTYQGKTVKQWFLLTDAGRFTLNLEGNLGRMAFREMGTNAIPFLAGLILRDLEPSLFENWIGNFPKKIRPRDKYSDAALASSLLRECISPTNHMLRHMLEPAVSGANLFQKQVAQNALRLPITYDPELLEPENLPLP